MPLPENAILNTKSMLSLPMYLLSLRNQQKYSKFKPTFVPNCIPRNMIYLGTNLWIKKVDNETAHIPSREYVCSKYRHFALSQIKA
uniref:Ovule protein n=1 Tax=Rhabditophanes sp. KR3021 TaxID=114890 RepID=A0AC35UEC4_9BILA